MIKDLGLLSKINNKTEKVLFSKIPLKNANTPNFTGNLLFTNLQGKLLTLFKVNNGVIYKGYKNKYLDAKGKRKARSKSSGDDCDENYAEGIFCLNLLGDVVIIASSGHSNYVPMQYVFFHSFPSYTPSNSSPFTWGYGGSGGYNPPHQETNCDNGKIYNTSTNRCECPDGYIEDVNGKCVEKPCNVINSQITNTGFKNKMKELNKLTSKKQETGYVQNKTGTYTKLSVINGGHSLDLKDISYANINGFIHTHLNNFPTGEIDKKTGLPKINKIYRIFSPADVIAFLAIAKRSNDISKVYATVITSSGDYTLKFTGNKNDITGLKEAKDYKEDYKKIMKKYKGSKEQGFLHFLKDQIKVDGIQLYKLHKPLFSSIIKIQHKTLNSKGKVDKTECE